MSVFFHNTVFMDDGTALPSLFPNCCSCLHFYDGICCRLVDDSFVDMVTCDFFELTTNKFDYE